MVTYFWVTSIDRSTSGHLSTDKPRHTGVTSTENYTRALGQLLDSVVLGDVVFVINYRDSDPCQH
jgi:hypothetical protein